MPASHTEPTQKTRGKPQPYKKNLKVPKASGDAPRTSALPPKRDRRSNLTLSDWLLVFNYVDTHPNNTQPEVVAHFANRPEGAFLFTQAALSRKLKERSELEGRVGSNPAALSSKRPRVVTRPDAERALIKWVHHMEGKNEQVNGAMLQAKRDRFEELFDVPEEERLTGPGWIGSFCRTYGIKERQKHGEAASVDLEAVARERVRVQGLLSRYANRDRFNFDETSFYSFAPPERGLSTKAMGGKKKQKFRITIGLACNADGTEKWQPVFIGFSKQPRCFKSRTAASMRIYYRNNKTAWMTRELFEEWITAGCSTEGASGNSKFDDLRQSD